MNLIKFLVLARNWILKYPVFTIVLLCFISRLPLLLSPNLLLDGDESVVGIMAKHFYEGKGIPYFFYGQPYGFSILEVSVISIFYSIFGITTVSVKLAMLCLWTMVMVVFYKTLKVIGSKNNYYLPFLVTLLFIFSPAMIIWSMKARGGYLTSFLLSSIIIYLISDNKKNDRLTFSLVIGVLLPIVYQSQALWLPGLVPIVIYHIVRKKSQFKHSIPLLLGILPPVYFFHQLKEGKNYFWNPKVINWFDSPSQPLFSFPEKIFQNLTGSFDYDRYVEPVIFNQVFSLLIMLAVFISLITAMFYLYNGKKINPLIYVFGLSVLVNLVYPIYFIDLYPRYFITITGFAYLMFFVILSTTKYKVITNSGIVLVILFGVISTYDFKNFDAGNSKEVKLLIEELNDKQVDYVFSEGMLLQWQITFYTKEKTIARFHPNWGRYEPYIKDANKALKHKEKNVVFVGYAKNITEEDSSAIIIGNEYYMITEPTKELVIKKGFDVGTDFDDL